MIWLQEYTYVLLVSVLVILAVATWFVVQYVLKRLEKTDISPAQNSEIDKHATQESDPSILKLIQIPLMIWIAALLVFMVIQITPWSTIAHIDGKSILNYSHKLMRAVSVLVLLVVTIRLINRSEKKLLYGEKKIGEEVEYVVQIGYKAVKFFLYAITLTSILNIFELTHLANQLFAVGAISSFVIGFAAQDTLANIFGSLTVILDRPFKVNDLIDSPDKSIKGFVEHVGWRATRVRDLNHGIKYIPNNNFTKITITNLSHSKVKKFTTTIGVRYQDIQKVSAICKDIEEAMKAHPETAKNSLCYAKFCGLGASSVDFKIVTFWQCQKKGVYDSYVESILQLIVKTVDKHEAGFPFPTTTLDAEELVQAIKDKS